MAEAFKDFLCIDRCKLNMYFCLQSANISSHKQPNASAMTKADVYVYYDTCTNGNRCWDLLSAVSAISVKIRDTHKQNKLI